MEITLTAKIRIFPTEEQAILLGETLKAYRDGSNYVSEEVFTNHPVNLVKLHQKTYQALRERFGLRSQMAQSVMKTVLARYKAAENNGHEPNLIRFKRPEYDLVWNRDYSLRKGLFSVNTLKGRVKVPFTIKGMERYFDGTWLFGTAKLVMKKGKFFLHIPMTKEIPELKDHEIQRVVGVDLGVNFLATVYDDQGKSLFVRGRTIKGKRSRFKKVRRQLQRKGTPSARRRLKRIGQRENRWMTDINHTVTKALVSRYGERTLFVLENLTGVRDGTERVRRKDRYETVSWAFYQFRQMLTYKAEQRSSKVIAIPPHYTSQTCPRCGHREISNRSKKTHTFCCKRCSYRSNDDRIGAMNLFLKGMEYLKTGALPA